MLASLALCLYSHPLRAETVYIGDTLYVPLRGGKSSEYRILHRGLKSGTEMERLETDKETGYSRVRLPGGMEGWLQSQYLVEEPVAADLLQATEQQLLSLETNYQRTLLRLQDSEETKKSLLSSSATLGEENAELKSELERITEMASNVIEINKLNATLQDDQSSLNDRISDLEKENEALTDSNAQSWFLRGAGTVLIGLLFGFWVARRIYHKRSGGWS